MAFLFSLLTQQHTPTIIIFSSHLSDISSLFRPDYKHTSAQIDVELPHHRRHYDADISIEVPHHRRQYHETEIDVTEREYRSRFQPTYREEVRVNETTVDPPRFRPTEREEVRVTEQTVDPPRVQFSRHPHHSSREEIRVTEQTVDPPRFKQDKMGYYDEDGKSISSIYPHHILNLLQVTITPSVMGFTVRLIVFFMDALITMRAKRLTLP